MIKVDLHMHSGEDPYDGLPFPATALVDKAVELGYGAIAITLHDRVLEDPQVFEYAQSRGLLLIPAVEWTLQRVDVLLYNVTQREVERLRDFETLRAWKQQRGDDVLVIAPHPFYPIHHSLKRYLAQYLDVFDAIEYTQLHLPWLNFNRPAQRFAEQQGKPLVANSDAHALWMFGNHYTLVDAAEPTMPAIFAAIRAGRVRWHSPPVTVWACFRMFVVDRYLRRVPGRLTASFGPTERGID